MREITILAPNKPGVLASVCNLLASKRINISSISAEGGFAKTGIIRLGVSNEKKASETLHKAKYKIITSDAFIVKLDDRPGQLAEISQMLADAGVNIESVNLIDKSGGKAKIAFRVDKAPLARKILSDFVI